VFCNSQARLFFHRPKFGVLDECTNATSVEVEEYLYRTAQALGITVITISQVRRPGERKMLVSMCAVFWLVVILHNLIRGFWILFGGT
jgi:ABC-type uncharacterized transport system fused permease/ATPase subunit